MHVHLDDVQYSKNTYFARNRVIDRAGREVMLAVPVRAQLTDTFITAAVVDNGWRRSHPATLRQLYGRFPAAAAYLEKLDDLFARPPTSLAELNIKFMSWLLDSLGIRTPVHRSSELGATGQSSDRLVALCQQLGGTEYYSPAGAREYIDAASFGRASIVLAFQDYTPEPYDQRLGAPFVPYLSAVDPLMRFGGEVARRIVLAGAR